MYYSISPSSSLFLLDEMEGEFKIAMLNGTPAQVQDAKQKLIECIQMVCFLFF